MKNKVNGYLLFILKCVEIYDELLYKQYYFYRITNYLLIEVYAILF